VSVATAPGKVMLAGEYAVLDGGTAIMIAIDRRAIATVGARRRPGSEFLDAAGEVLASEVGADAADALAHTTVDTDALRQDRVKLGLGSSAAATVAAIGAALGAVDRFDRAHVAALAATAHARAQGKRGAAGSGADIAVSSHGGALAFTRGQVAPLTLPETIALDFAWTGAAADTATLVAAITAARTRTGVDAALIAIAAAAAAIATATDADAALAGFAAAAAATTRLADAAAGEVGDDDIAQTYRAAVQAAVGGDFDVAVEGLLAMLPRQRVWQDGAVRKTLVDIFNVLGADERVKAWRTRMARSLN